MEATEEVTRAAIDLTVLDSQQVTTGDISPAIDPTQPIDNARGVGPNNIQQEDEDLQLIPPNGIPGSVALGINFNCDVFKHDFLMRDAAWRSDKINIKDKASVETSYLSICNDFKLVAASYLSPQLFYEHLKSIFDSYVNPDNNPDVQHLVKGLDAEDFDVNAFLGTNMGGRKEEMTLDFVDGLFVHDVRRLESEIENIRGEPQQDTRATARLRLNYEQDVLPPPTAEENVTNSTVVPTVGCSIDLTTDEAVDEPCSPLDRQIISVVPSQRVDLTVVVSPEANRYVGGGWNEGARVRPMLEGREACLDSHNRPGHDYGGLCYQVG
ncbi:hypothetical protein R1flu_000435 [Riccia fluitans]|uniref:Uncharacterized protein n=1 Tax=Riccia fluitans TaxID=41844 RepID=A0ABD1Y0G8_9MARC